MPFEEIVEIGSFGCIDMGFVAVRPDYRRLHSEDAFTPGDLSAYLGVKILMSKMPWSDDAAEHRRVIRPPVWA